MEIDLEKELRRRVAIEVLVNGGLNGMDNDFEATFDLDGKLEGLHGSSERGTESACDETGGQTV